MSSPCTVKRPAGYTVRTFEFGGVAEHDTLQCVHCGTHWEIMPGSGITRGFCRNCMGPVCGPRCQHCYPSEKQLDDLERISAPTIII